MLLGWHYSDCYAHAFATNQYLVAGGFRLGIGYGRAFQHTAGAGVAGASEYRDVLADQTIDLVRRLDVGGIPYREMIFSNESHLFPRSQDWLTADTASVRFRAEQFKP